MQKEEVKGSIHVRESRSNGWRMLGNIKGVGGKAGLVRWELGF